MKHVSSLRFPAGCRPSALATLIALSSLGLPALAAPVGATPSTPDSGQILQQIQAPAAPTAPTTPAPTLLNPQSGETTTETQAAQAAHLSLKQLAFQGNTVYDSATLTRVANLAPGDVSLADLRAAAHRVSQYYRAHGYLLARTFLPAQNVNDGVVTLTVLEGKLGGTRVDNHSRVSTAHIQAVLDAQATPQAPLRVDAANRALIILQDTSGIGAVQGNLSPGQQVGTTELAVDAGRAPLVSGNLGADNYGNSYTGQERLTGGLNVDSLTGLGDRLSVQGAISHGDNLNYGRLAWDVPVGDDGLRLGAALSNTRYELGGTFAALDSHGTARTAALYGSYPLLLAPTTHVNLDLSLERRALTDIDGVTETENRRSATAGVLTVSGDFLDGWLGTPARNAWRLAGTIGSLELRTPSVAALDAESAKTAGSYDKAVFSASREQTLFSRTSLYLSGTVQKGNKNLDSSEQFFLGGANGIRAYPQGEAPGDQGWLGTAELRYALLPALQLVAFHDMGMVEANHHPFIDQRNGRHLSGSGVGANASWGAFSAKASLAWRGGSDAPISDTDRRPRLWLQGAYNF